MSKSQPPKKDASLCVRLPRETLKHLRAMERRAGISLANLVSALLEDIRQYEEQHDELRLPLQVIPCSELKALRAAADGQQE